MIYYLNLNLTHTYIMHDLYYYYNYLLNEQWLGALESTIHQNEFPDF